MKQGWEDVGQLCDREFRPAKSIWGPVIRDSEIVLLYAGTGVGKSHIGFGVAGAASAGAKFLRYDCPKKTPTLYGDGELGLRECQRRFRSVDKGLGESIRGSDIRVMSYEHYDGRIPNLSSYEGQKAYTKAAEGYDFIVIDNLNCCSYPENSRDDEISRWHRVYDWALQMKKAGKSILFIHHTNKGREQQSGGQIKEDQSDTVIFLKRADESLASGPGLTMELHFQKTRHFYGADAEPLLIEMVVGEEGTRYLWWDLKERQRAEIETMLWNGAKDKAIADYLGMTPFMAQRYMKSIGVRRTEDGGGTQAKEDDF